MIRNTVAAELLAMAKVDQEMRLAAIKDFVAWDGTVDIRHAARMKTLIQEYGWPGIGMVGVEASSAAWLLAQHADHDPAFQEWCLGLMKALPEGEVFPRNVAYLEDRILVHHGNPQLYGTQFEGVGKDLRPRPIADEARLDERRAAMDLGSFADYVRQMHEIYDESEPSPAG